MILRYQLVSLGVRNSEKTKETILQESGILFNTQGYKATSISHITEATGFTKGAIYRHFENKEELEKESLYYLSSIMFEKLRTVIKEEQTAGNKLRAVFRFFENYVSNPPLKGGCPLLNVAIEADDCNPLLRAEALKILKILRDSIETILENGKKYGQFKQDFEKKSFATLLIAALEGGIMMSKLSGNNSDIKRVISHLEIQINQIEI